MWYLIVSIPDLCTITYFCVPVTAFVQICRPRGSDVNTKGSDTLVGRLRKAGMYPAFIYLFIFFYFILFYFISIYFFC